MGFDHPWGKDRRPFRGGEYPYETVVTVYLPEGVAPSAVDGTALESRGMALLGQLEVNRRLARLPSMATHYTEADGTYYEYGFIMGRPFVRVWPVAGTLKPTVRIYRGLAYAASVPDTVGEYGEFFRYPYDGTMNNYGTRQSYLSSAVPPSVLDPNGRPVIQSVARLTGRAQTEVAPYQDTLRGVLEGGRVYPHVQQPYWVREAVGETPGITFRDTDEVWTNAGDTIWCNNKAVGAYAFSAGFISYWTMPFPAGKCIMLLGLNGFVGYIPLRSNPAEDTPGIEIDIVSDGPYYHPRARTLDVATAIITPSGYSGNTYPAVSQRGTKFALYDGQGWGRAYALSLDVDGNPVATETHSFLGAPSGSYPRVNTTGDKFNFTVSYASDISDNYTAGLCYVDDELVVITATVEASKHGSASTVSSSDSPISSYSHSGDVTQTQKCTLDWGTGSIVTHDTRNTYAAIASWAQTVDGFANFDVSYVSDVELRSNSIERTILLLDIHNDVIVYFESVTDVVTSFQEDHSHQDVFAGWGFRLIPGYFMSDDPDLFIPDPSGHDPIDQPTISVVTTRNYKLAVRFGGNTYENIADEQVVNDTTTNIQDVGLWLNRGDSLAAWGNMGPVMQGMCPYIAYRHPNTNNAKMICAHGIRLDNVVPDTYLNSTFTERGVEDWLTSCGVPAAVTTRVATCFRIGGPRLPNEA